MKYIQDDWNVCCFGCLSSSLYASGGFVEEQGIAARIQEFLVIQSIFYEDRIFLIII